MAGAMASFSEGAQEARPNGREGDPPAAARPHAQYEKWNWTYAWFSLSTLKKPWFSL
jgi:hypothetical protein